MVVCMRIGIDIDDTLTDIKDELADAAFKYAESLGKSIQNKNLEINDIYANSNIYQRKYDFTYEELKFFLGTIQEEITNNAIPRPYCVDIIRKLHNDGNEIYIITARDSEFHEEPYLQSKAWLNKNNIYFDKLIVNARDKKKVCLEYDIDLLIDDNISNCLAVSSSGIQTLMIGNGNGNHYEIKNLDNWQQIYNFLCVNSIFKIISYDDSYKNEICSFINESMHKFIGRPYKERLDVSNIMDYYFRNHGFFWLAIDVKNKKVIGTIALENRDNQYGILKRFYVDEEYQNNGVGSKLYEIFYNYVETKTKINKIYLTCGKVLKKAHHFYISKGFIYQNTLDIEMHYARDDDFFVKNIDRD